MGTIENESDAGAPNMDAMSAPELRALWVAWGMSSVRPIAQARKMFPTRPVGYVEALRMLRNYASNKATAMECRERGTIPTALMYEGICERIYDRLPKWARW